MLRRLIEWVVGKKKPDKPAIECLTEVLPIVFAAGILIASFKYLSGDIKVPWYKKL